MKSPDAKALVQAHRKNIFITVGSDEILTDGLADGLSDRDFGTLEDIMGAEYFAPKHQINTSFQTGYSLPNFLPATSPIWLNQTSFSGASLINF